MIDTEKIRNVSDTEDVCRTFSKEGYKLLQTDTGVTYGYEVIDEIAGMNGDKPFSRFSYIETDEIDEYYLEMIKESEEKENESVQENPDEKSFL